MALGPLGATVCWVQRDVCQPGHIAPSGTATPSWGQQHPVVHSDTRPGTRNAPHSSHRDPQMAPLTNRRPHPHGSHRLSPPHEPPHPPGSHRTLGGSSCPRGLPPTTSRHAAVRSAVQGDPRPFPRPTPCHRGDPTPRAPTHSAPRRAGPEGAGGPCGCGGRSVWRGAVRPGPARPGSTPPPPPPAARSRRRGAAGEVWSRRGAARGRRGSEHRGRPRRAGGWATRSGRRRAASGGAGCAQQQVPGDGTGSPGAVPPGAGWDGGGEGAARASPRPVGPCGSLGGRG